MNLSDYKELYEQILKISFDMSGESIFIDPTKECIEKCKWICAILKVLNDVPKNKMETLFILKKIEFDYCNFLEENLN